VPPLSELGQGVGVSDFLGRVRIGSQEMKRRTAAAEEGGDRAGGCVGGTRWRRGQRIAVPNNQVRVLGFEGFVIDGRK
jgi:hypothetical protein